MIQFNLLPDVKIQYIKARRTKHLMMLASIVVIGVSLFVFILMLFTVNVVQKKSLGDLNKDIKKYSADLKATPDLDKILTVQNQLGALTDLHEQKPVSSRVYGYLAQVTPVTIKLTSMNLDLEQNTVVLSGTAPSLESLYAYTATLKATKYTVGDSTDRKSAFTNVVWTSYGRDKTGANFTLSASFDAEIFKSENTVNLKVPTQTTADPATLFSTEGL
ncbi:hypothetical protein EYC59_03450 [Candidatus Saccharibacteria bacterium]|nr:MAG: hypothetical protein EYC59_03450 [Candidatus Saccharibacteria bacterium]